MVEQMYTVGDVAKRVRVSRFTINRWIADGTLKAVDINPSSEGRAMYRIEDSVLQDLIDRLKGNTVRRAKGRAPERKAKPEKQQAKPTAAKRGGVKQMNRVKEFV